MVNVWITEYKQIGDDGKGHLVQAKREPAIKTTKQTFTGTSSLALDDETMIVQLYGDAIFHINFEAAADGDDEPVPAETVADRVVVGKNTTLYLSDGS